MAPPAQQRGVALAIVVWFIAAMSLLVAGIVHQAKVDIRFAQMHAAQARATAAGDGAIQLALAAQMHKGSDDGESDTPDQRFVLGDIAVEVAMWPSAGLVDLNVASPEILQLLLVYGADVAPEDAAVLAANVVEWRSNRVQGLDPSIRAGRFKSPEDLFRVGGFNRAILDRLRDLVTVNGGARSGIDFKAAPPAVLAVLAQGEFEQAQQALDERQSAGSAAAGGGLASRRLRGASRSYRVDARVTLGDSVWLRRRWVQLGYRGANVLLPWRFTRTEAARLVSANE